MGLLTHNGFDTAFVAGLKDIPAAFMPCTIQIAQETAKPVWVPEDKAYSVPAATILYTGPARVTPRRSALNRPLRENPTTVQSVQFQIPIDGYTFDLRNNCAVTVTSSPLNARLLTYSYRVSELVDSSNPIEYTFWGVVDQEVVL